MALVRKSGAGLPWKGLPIHVSLKVKAFFHMAVESKVGNGEQTLFWKYRWIMGQFMLNFPKSIKNHPHEKY